MRKSAAIAVAVGVLGLVFVPSAGAHNMDLNTANNVSLDQALADCNASATCIAYGAFPCRKVSRHKAICTEHLVHGTPGDQASQQDCHRDIGLKLKRRSFGIKIFSLGSFHCSPNAEHPGF